MQTPTDIWDYFRHSPKSGQVVKWKCLMDRTVSPRIMRNSEMFQSGKWDSFSIVTCKNRKACVWRRPNCTMIFRRISSTRLNVPVVDGLRVVRPVVVALFPPLFDAARQHHDGPRVRLPTHPPEVVPRRVERPLRHDELPRGIVAGHEIGVDEVRALLVIGWLKKGETRLV